MSELTEFLLARIAEDEQTAKEAMSGSWQHDPSKVDDPVRVVRACAAKRRIVEQLHRALEDGSADYALGLTVAVQHLAAAYADHSGYRQEWADQS